LTHLLGSLLSHISLEEHLKRELSRFAAGSHRQPSVYRRRIDRKYGVYWFDFFRVGGDFRF
jgi:hypothetical protein